MFECLHCRKEISFFETPFCGACCDLIRLHAHFPCAVCLGIRDACSIECSRPWARILPSGRIYTSYLLIGPTHIILKRWKTHPGLRMDKKILSPILSQPEMQLSSYAGIIPIPQSFKRSLQMKGQRPSLRIARFFSRRYETPIIDILTKADYGFQAKKGYQQRFNEPPQFAIYKKPMALHKRFLLVDDFLTTGLTLQRAALALEKHGFKEVDAYVLGYRPKFKAEG